MASTFSDLKIELMATGEQSGTWGTTTNTNLGTAIEQAITGSGDVSFSSADVTLTLTDTNASQTARNLRLNLTGTSGGARNLIVPAIEKQYIINNGLADAVTVKNSTGTGVAVPAGKTMVVFNNATDVVDVTTHASSLTLGSALPVASGGTGQTTYTNGQLLIGDSTGNTLAKSTLTAGSGVSITNGSGSITISATGSGGDVVGPASSTDNAVVRFDGTTGKLVQNSGVLIADDGTTVISVNSATDALRITQTGAGNALVVEDSSNPDATPFVVDAEGLIITGNTTAISALGFNNQLQVLGTSNAYQLNAAFRNDAFAPFLSLAHSRNATIGSHTIVQSGDALGTFAFLGSDGTNFIQAARIVSAVDGTPGTNDMPGRLVFSTTADGASTPTERMRIDSAGSVGIGTTPAAGTNLHIGKSLTGATIAISLQSNPQIQSDVTDSVYAYNSAVSTAAAAFNLTNLIYFRANQATIGAGSSITNQYGFFAIASLTGATNNYGFYSNIASGTGRWNFYANGTAANFFGGVTTFRAANAVRVEAAATQDAVVIAGRAGGTSSYAVTLTPATLSASRTATLPDGGGNYTLGYLNIPAVGTKTGSYTLATADVGKYVQVGSGGSITIPDATFAEGDVIAIFNNTTGNITITCTITTAYIAGTDTDKATVTLATRGVANILFISGTVCVITGNVS